MKIAYLLPGFVRKKENLDTIKTFLENNNSHQIDIYSSTYNIYGAETKEPSRGYSVKNKLSQNFADNKFIFKKLKINNYDDINDEISKFGKKYNYLIKKSNPEVWERINKSMLSVEDESTILRLIYGQWSMLLSTFNLIENPDNYDLIIRSRYDADVNFLKLDKFINTVHENTIYLKLRSNEYKLDNSLKINPINDVLTMGNPISMKIFCEFGKKENLIKLFEDHEFSSTDFYKEKGKDIKLSSEMLMYYWLFIVNKLEQKDIPEFLFPSNGILKRNKWPSEEKLFYNIRRKIFKFFGNDKKFFN